MSAISSVAAPVHVGPSDVLAPVGGPELEFDNGPRGVVKSQAYEDGTLFEVQVPIGSSFDSTLFEYIPMGVWHGVRETNDGRLLISVWAPKN